MLRVGVTGGIGSGKSLVCGMFTRQGIPVLSADRIAKQIMRRDKVLRRKLTSLLGSSSYGPGGALNKGHIAAKIFSSPLLQRKVNAIVHPRVEAELEKRFLKLSRSGNRIGIVEAALIFESGYDKSLDFVIVVDAPERKRIQRVVSRDKTSAREVRKRIRAQLPIRKKLEQADYVIRNKGSIKDLEYSVRFLIMVLKKIAQQE